MVGLVKVKKGTGCDRNGQRVLQYHDPLVLRLQLVRAQHQPTIDGLGACPTEILPGKPPVLSAERLSKLP